MAKTIERADGNWLDRLLNRWPFCIDTDHIVSLLAVCLGYKEVDLERFMVGRDPHEHFFAYPPEAFFWRVGHAFFGPSAEDRSLFMNAILFVRITYPLGIWLHVKPVRWGRFQCGLGWKLNGRAAALCRVQSDDAAARGVSGPNTGQAAGWERGTA